MAKGLTKHRARLEALNQLGKDLTRRSHSHCELCGRSGVRLEVIEVPPLPPEPEMDHCLFVCEMCHSGMETASLNGQYWRFLETAIWSDLPPVQVTAVRLTRQLSTQGENWATALLDNLYLEPAITTWLQDM